eukprot:3154558-Amphidinium_carterae.1
MLTIPPKEHTSWGIRRQCVPTMLFAGPANSTSLYPRQLSCSERAALSHGLSNENSLATQTVQTDNLSGLHELHL